MRAKKSQKSFQLLKNAAGGKWHFVFLLGASLQVRAGGVNGWGAASLSTTSIILSHWSVLPSHITPTLQKEGNNNNNNNNSGKNE